ncbi:O-antigen translocase [Aminobacter sp. AP02]|uniref:O-antigen translocase n=1 Tax=Aminobacter sp. AP02 TaxID=2135737 RepID=UPI000D6C1FD1|nr:O-antigen translocase [Aminobacter sp. AP02]PWK76885.1 PST family polysaccharide transporter [Aminobacter sp. AP02]
MATTNEVSSGKSYVQILRSTAVIGGSSVVNIGFAIVRNKGMAVLLGPEGVGLMGLYSSIVDLAQTLGGLGVQASGVRQIAEAAGSGDEQRVARTAKVLRRISLVLGLIGAVLLALLSLPVAVLTFDDRGHAAGVAILGLAVFFRTVAAGQGALIQGLREISSLARITMLGAFFSTVIALPTVYFFGAQGIVPALVAMATVSMLTSWWHSRKIKIAPTTLSLQQVGQEASALLKLGVAFMASAVLTFGAAYVIRIIVLRHDGVVAAGLYQAAWALGGLYAGFILQAMGTDFYPRLTGVSRDNAACNRLVNEQTQISMLLAGPGLLATLTLAPVAMTLFYTPEFQPAVNLLRWICLGMMLRIISWPMGFIVLAKGAQRVFFWMEVAATVVHVGLAWLLVPMFGPIGAGGAFFGLYLWHGMLTFLVARRLSGLRWSGMNQALAVGFLSAAAVVFAACLALPFWIATAIGALVTVASGLCSLRILLKLLPLDALPQAIRPWLPKPA